LAGVTTKGVYGLAAMYELACHYKQGHLKIQEIADQADIPSNYLEQILATLRKEGLIQSIRGASGGYQLMIPPSDISVYTILITLEGELCLLQEGSNAVLNKLWEQKRHNLKELFSETLQDLLDEGEKLGHQTMFFI
jgi:Rrf2 family protein